jgi:hypothetical protein
VSFVKVRREYHERNTDRSRRDTRPAKPPRQRRKEGNWQTGEIMIDAPSQQAALRACRLLIASIVVVNGGDAFFLPQPFECEFLAEVGAPENRQFSTLREGLMQACVLAGRASRIRSLGYAVHKLRLSYELVAPALADLDPAYGGPKRFLVGSDPIEHVYSANAVTLAYSVIEELGFEVRVKPGEQSKMPDGTWNPRVRADLEARLIAVGIGINQTHIWSLRGPPTRIEKAKRPPTAVRKPVWSRGPESARIDLATTCEALRPTMLAMYNLLRDSFF